jgi:hypothetical protein
MAWHTDWLRRSPSLVSPHNRPSRRQPAKSEGRIFKMGVTFTIVQSGGEIAGAWTTTGGTSGTLSGVLTENGIRELRARQLNPCVGDFGGVAVLEAGMTLRGSYVGRDCSGAVTASFSVTRQ